MKYKLLLLLFALLIVIPISLGVLSDGLYSCCDYNGTSQTGNNHSTGKYSSPTINTTHCLYGNKCVGFAGNTGWNFNSIYDDLLDGDHNFTINIWNYRTGTTLYGSYLFGAYSDVYAQMFFDGTSGQEGYSFFHTGAWQSTGFHQTNEDVWVMNTVVYEEGKNLTLYRNATYLDSITSGLGTWTNVGNDNWCWGTRFGGDQNRGFVGLSQGLAVWNRALSLAEINEAYSNHQGFACPFTADISVSWKGYTPLNNSLMSYLEPIFFNHTDCIALNCSLWKNYTETVDYDVSPEGLVGFWRFEEGSGNVSIDSSSTNNNGTIFGAVYSSSKGGNGTGSYALDFDGVNDYVDLGNNYNFERNDSFSYGCWFNTTITADRVLMGKMDETWRGSLLFIYSGQIYWTLHNNIGNLIRVHTNDVFNNGYFHHVVGTYNGSSLASGLKVYVDGVSRSVVIDDDILSGTILDTANFRIGSKDDDSLFFFGDIDEVSIFNKTLNLSEILDIYNNGINITQENVTTGFVTIQNLTNVVGSTLYNFSDYTLSNDYYDLYITCNSLNSSHKFIGVNGTVPIINFLNLQNFYVNSPLVQGGVYEFAEGVWNLSVNVTYATHYNFSFFNRTSLESEVFDTGIINLQSSTFNNFVDKNLFNVSVIAYNSFGSNFNSLEFAINDTILPLCNGTLTNTYTKNDTDFVWNVTCIDELFFSFNMSCSNNYSFYKEDILSTSYFFNGSTRVRYNITCDYEFCDGHTKAKIDNFYIKKDLDNKSFIVENKKLVLSHSVKDITWKKKTDRYEFCFDFESTAKLKQVNVLIPDGCHYVSSKWQGHLVCPDERMWFDFENDNVKATITKDRVLLDLSKVKGNKVCFNSVGKFNCVSGVQKIGASYHVPFFTFQRFECDMSTTPKAISFIGILFFVLAIWIFALWSKIGILNLFVGFVWLWSITWQVSACFEFANILMIIMGLVSLGAGLTYSYSAWTAH